MLRFTCFLLFVALASGLDLKLQLNNQWQKFKSVHAKKYTGAEEVKRQGIFKQNVEAILQHNLKTDLGTETYTQGVNEFSDMTHEEFKKTMLGLNLNATISTRSASPWINENLNLPATVDWRTSGAVTYVRNQGSCGSCWTFATVGAVEGNFARKNGRQVILSEQNLLDCADRQSYGCNGCQGGLPDRAMEYVLKNGVDLGSCYPYYGQELGYCAFNPSCRGATISGYVMIPEGSESALKQAVFKGGPLSIGFDAGQPSLQSYKGGVYNPSYCDQQGNHAVLLVGYGTQNGLDYWLIKNSWGTSWGEQGYFKIARNQGNKCGISNYAQYVF